MDNKEATNNTNTQTLQQVIQLLDTINLSGRENWSKIIACQNSLQEIYQNLQEGTDRSE